jgi:hypothetical protein
MFTEKAAEQIIHVVIRGVDLPLRGHIFQESITLELVTLPGAHRYRLASWYSNSVKLRNRPGLICEPNREIRIIVMVPPKSVIGAKRFRGNKLWLDDLGGSSPKAGVRAAYRSPKPPRSLRFGTQGTCADPSPFSEGRQDNDDDILAPPMAQTPCLAVTRETQAGSQLQGSRASSAVTLLG